MTYRPKKAAIDEVVKRLESDANKLRWDISRNRREMKKLTDRQTVLKRQLPILTDLIRGLRGDERAKQ